MRYTELHLSNRNNQIISSPRSLKGSSRGPLNSTTTSPPPTIKDPPASPTATARRLGFYVRAANRSLLKVGASSENAYRFLHTFIELEETTSVPLLNMFGELLANLATNLQLYDDDRHRYRIRAFIEVFKLTEQMDALSEVVDLSPALDKTRARSTLIRIMADLSTPPVSSSTVWFTSYDLLDLVGIVCRQYLISGVIFRRWNVINRYISVAIVGRLGYNLIYSLYPIDPIRYLIERLHTQPPLYDDVSVPRLYHGGELLPSLIRSFKRAVVSLLFILIFMCYYPSSSVIDWVIAGYIVRGFFQAIIILFYGEHPTQRFLL
ncbi:hypothetical protein FT663_02326 [Candidozyma haemuli var. vulneris]|nr:hypothetical protein FT662_02498 [[Candida] haemuloni var. vulneris]KAF3992399.1 hypothetical protein FT663_02326 [[Candida] haemuloni var. vulneris]